MCHDGVYVGVGDGSVFAAENLVGTEPQRVQQLLLAELAKKEVKKPKKKKPREDSNERTCEARNPERVTDPTR